MGTGTYQGGSCLSQEFVHFSARQTLLVAVQLNRHFVRTYVAVNDRFACRLLVIKSLACCSVTK